MAAHSSPFKSLQSQLRRDALCAPVPNLWTEKLNMLFSKEWRHNSEKFGCHP